MPPYLFFGPSIPARELLRALLRMMWVKPRTEGLVAFTIERLSAIDVPPEGPRHRAERNYFLALEKAVSITSPIDCQVRPSNWPNRRFLIGWKSQGPVLILMPGSKTDGW